MAEEKTIIIKNEELKKTFTIKLLIVALKKFKYWILGIACLFAVFGYLLTKLAINPLISKVSSTFSYSFIYSEYKDSIATLSNGTKINLLEIVNKDNIVNVYENTMDDSGKRVFSSLSIDSILKNGNFKLSIVSRDNNTNNYDKKETLEGVDITLTSSVKPFLFKEDLAKLFMQKLIELPLNKVNDSYKNYRETNYLLNLDNNTDFITSTKLLSTQYDSISKTYDTLIKQFGPNTIISNYNLTLTELKNNFETSFLSFDEIETNSLSSLLYSYGYINYNESNVNNVLNEIQEEKQSTLRRKETLEIEIKRIKDVLDSYKDVTIDETNTLDEYIASDFRYYLNTYNELLSKLEDNSLKLGLLEKQEGNLSGNSITNGWSRESNNIFKNRVMNLSNRLSGEREKLNSVINCLYIIDHPSSINFSSSNNIAITSYVPIPLIAIVSLIIGFIVSLLSFGYYVSSKPAIEQKDKEIKELKEEK